MPTLCNREEQTGSCDCYSNTGIRGSGFCGCGTCDPCNTCCGPPCFVPQVGPIRYSSASWLERLNLNCSAYPNCGSVIPSNFVYSKSKNLDLNNIKTNYKQINSLDLNKIDFSKLIITKEKQEKNVFDFVTKIENKNEEKKTVFSYCDKKNSDYYKFLSKKSFFLFYWTGKKWINYSSKKNICLDNCNLSFPFYVVFDDNFLVSDFDKNLNYEDFCQLESFFCSIQKENCEYFLQEKSLIWHDKNFLKKEININVKKEHEQVNEQEDKQEDEQVYFQDSGYLGKKSITQSACQNVKCKNCSYGCFEITLKRSGAGCGFCLNTTTYYPIVFDPNCTETEFFFVIPTNQPIFTCVGNGPVSVVANSLNWLYMDCYIEKFVIIHNGIIKCTNSVFACDGDTVLFAHKLTQQAFECSRFYPSLIEWYSIFWGFDPPYDGYKQYVPFSQPCNTKKCGPVMPSFKKQFNDLSKLRKKLTPDRRSILKSQKRIII